MLYFIFLFNMLHPEHMSYRVVIIVFTIPSAIFWYIAFVYNDFLCLTPISYELFMVLFFSYAYSMIYLFFSSHANTLKSPDSN